MQITKILCGVLLLHFIGTNHHSITKVRNIDNDTLRIMTYNIRHGSPIHHAKNDIQLDRIADAINAQKPDVVALQEVDSMTKRAPLDEAKELGKLTGMYYIFSKTIDFDGGKYGGAILSRYPILASTHDSLFLPDSSGEARAIQIITINLPMNGKINFATTHLELKPLNRLAEINQIKQISKRSKYPLIVAGDFNATPDSKDMSLFKSEFTFSCETNCPFTFPSDNPKSTIDYIILNQKAIKEFHVVNYNVVQHVYASDHLPLVGLLISSTNF